MLGLNPASQSHFWLWFSISTCAINKYEKGENWKEDTILTGPEGYFLCD